MKILYELVITEETGFTATDFPDRFEILRKGKTPLVFKPVVINLQAIYSRLNEAEILLNLAKGINRKTTVNQVGALKKTIGEYFDRHAQ